MHLYRERTSWLPFVCLLMVSGCVADKETVEPEVKDPNYGNFDPDHILQVELTMAESDWDTMRYESRSFFSEFLGDCMDQPFSGNYSTFSADISIDGESLSNIGIRKKGFIGSQSVDRPGFKINLDEYVQGAELFGVDNVTLNNAVQDPAIIRQCLGYDLFRQAGLAAPRCNFARVSMNGQDLGIYAHVEPIKRSFLRDHFGSDDGDLYEGTLSDFHPQKYLTFDSKNSDTDESLTAIAALTEALESSSPDTLKAILDEHIDLDHFLTFWAMETLTGHWDGYTGNLNNFYVYRPMETERFVFIPWGMDGIMSPDMLEGDQHEPSRGVMSVSVIPVAILESDAVSDLFYDRLDSLLETVWNETEILSEIDRMEALLSTEIDMDERSQWVDGLREYVNGRRDQLIGTLPASVEGISPPFCIVEMGSLTCDFETTWGTMGDDLVDTGVAELDVQWEGSTIEMSQAGAGAGPSEDDPEKGAELAIVGLINPDEQSVLIPYFVFDADSAVSGEPLLIGVDEMYSGLYYSDASMGHHFVEAAWMNGGSLTFDSFQQTAGGTVSGSVSTTLYNWVEFE